MRDEIEKKMIESLPLIQLEKHRAHISKGQEYQVSDLFRVRLDSEDPILIGPESRKVKIPQFMRLRLPFAALDLRTIATKLESFLATNKDYTPSEFLRFVCDAPMFGLEGVNKREPSAIFLPHKIFANDKTDDGRVAAGDLIFQNLGKEDLFPTVKTARAVPDVGNNKVLLTFQEAYHIEIPLSYCLLLTRREMSDRFNEAYRKLLEDSVTVESTFFKLAKLEIVLGKFPKEAIQPLTDSVGPTVTHLEISPKKRLFLQREGGSRPIEVVEAPEKGKEESTRQRFLGEAVLRNRWTGTLLDHDSREIER